MEITKNVTPAVSKVVTPAQFKAVSIVFDNEAEYNDVVAALTAYSRKLVNVSGTSIKGDKGLKAYTGNARRTVNALLSRLP
jgi:hypothetical protein